MKNQQKAWIFLWYLPVKRPNFWRGGHVPNCRTSCPLPPPFPTLMTKTGERLRTDIQIFGDSSFCRYKFYPVIHWGSWRGISSNKKCFHSSRIRCSLRSVKLAIYKEHLDHFCCLSHNNNNNNTLIYIAPACRMTSCHKTQTHVWCWK